MKDIKVTRFRQGANALLAHFSDPSDGFFSRVLSAEDVATVVARHVKVFRQRIFSPVDTLRLFIGQMLSADGACQDVVARRACEQVAKGNKRSSLSSASYCQARARLPAQIPQELCSMLGLRLHNRAPAQWSWQGRQVKLFDATVMSMPDTPSNQQAYPQNGREKPGLGFPKARVGALISLSTGALLGHATAPCKGKGTGEQGLLCRLLERIDANDVVLADALLAGWWSICDIHARGADVVMPQNGRRATDFRRGMRLGKGDHVVEWPRPPKPQAMSREQYESYPQTLVMREVRVNGRVLVTTMLEPRLVSASALDKLYSARWNIELDFRTIKCTMQMDVLRCKSAQMIEKEIATGLLAYNMVRWAMASAAALHEVLPRALSFKDANRVLSAFADRLRHATQTTITVVLEMIANLQVPFRPDRIEPRAKKRRPKNLPVLMVPRDQARAAIRLRRGLS